MQDRRIICFACPGLGDIVTIMWTGPARVTALNAEVKFPIIDIKEEDYNEDFAAYDYDIKTPADIVGLMCSRGELPMCNVEGYEDRPCLKMYEITQEGIIPFMGADVSGEDME